MRYAIWSFVSLTAVLFSMLTGLSFAADNPVADEYRMLWAANYDSPGSYLTPQAVTAFVQTAKKYNYNAIIPNIVDRGMAFYDSRLLPRSPKIPDPAFDPLLDLIQKAHDTSGGQPYLEVHPWIVIYPCWRGKEPPSPKHVAARHPEWLSLAYENGKTTSTRQGMMLDPGVPGVQKYLAQVCAEIVQNYDVDGINLDYIRYDGDTTGYNTRALELFRKDTNFTGIPKPEDPAWAQWRRDRVTNLVRRVYVETKRVKPHVRVSACTITWGALDTGWQASAAYTKALQDWCGWMREGILDINMPMDYKREQVPEQKRDFRDWIDLTVAASFGRLPVIGLGLYLNSIDESIIQMREVRKRRAAGTTGFRYGYTYAGRTPEEKFYAAVKSALFTMPANVPSTPWLEEPRLPILTGRVFDARSKLGMRNVIVCLDELNLRTATDDNGYYSFVSLPPGTYTLCLARDPHVPCLKKAIVELPISQVVTKNIKL